MRILFKFPSRSRPDKFFGCLQNFGHHVTDWDNFRLLVSLDSDDQTLQEYLSIIERFKEQKLWQQSLYLSIGTSISKVDAINRDIDTIDKVWIGTWDLLCLHSDDFWVIKAGFDDDIREAFSNFSGLVHFPDGQVNERLCTYPMMSRDYYEQYGYIYHPSYKSVFADNEQHQVAVNQRRYKYVNKKILEHRHPAWGFGEPDALLRHTESFWEEDKKTFFQRQAKNFPIKWPL